jgi:hypothetical protein
MGACFMLLKTPGMTQDPQPVVDAHDAEHFEGTGVFEGTGTFEGSGRIEGTGTFTGEGTFEEAKPAE